MTYKPMTNEEKKLIFEYCGWHDHTPLFPNSHICEHCGFVFEGDMLEWNHSLNGNDILEAVKIMEEKEDWDEFTNFIESNFYSHINFSADRFPYLLQNFFPLMGEWLKEKNKEEMK